MYTLPSLHHLCLNMHPAVTACFSVRYHEFSFKGFNFQLIYSSDKPISLKGLIKCLFILFHCILYYQYKNYTFVVFRAGLKTYLTVVLMMSYKNKNKQNKKK